MLEREFDQIPQARKAQLRELGAYIHAKIQTGAPARLTVICTHNSRRSHIGQLWLKAAAVFYGLGKVETYAGGTEATAFNPRAVEAMRKAGFAIAKISDGGNPRYEARLGEDLPSQMLFSKKFSDEPNPQKGFAAVLVCSDADEACPFVPGADGRFAIPYEDPKMFDGTPLESKAYDERCRQIGREMLFAMSQARAKLAVQ